MPKAKIAVLFDGAGLARLALEEAGHECVGIEVDPRKHFLSKFVGSGRCILGDVRDFDLSDYDAVWASPPCQLRSDTRTQGPPKSKYSGDYMQWSLDLKAPVLWVENIMKQSPALNRWGKTWNAAQFLEVPIQNRNRVVGGRYPDPYVFREYRKEYGKTFPGLVGCVTATENKGCATDKRRASRFYGRRLTVDEVAYHQGFTIPREWTITPPGELSATTWRNNIYEALGNGVPVYMARAFGKALMESR